MIDANQRWDVREAVEWTRALAPFRPLWIEEPTSPDDVLGHATIASQLAPLGSASAFQAFLCSAFQGFSLLYYALYTSN